MTLEKKNCRSLEEQITKLKHELNVAESKLSEREKEFEAYKLLQKSQPEVKLQQQVHILTLEKHDLEKKFDAGKRWLWALYTNLFKICLILFQH